MVKRRKFAVKVHDSSTHTARTTQQRSTHRAILSILAALRLRMFQRSLIRQRYDRTPLLRPRQPLIFLEPLRVPTGRWPGVGYDRVIQYFLSERGGFRSSTSIHPAGGTTAAGLQYRGETSCPLSDVTVIGVRLLKMRVRALIPKV